MHFQRSRGTALELEEIRTASNTVLVTYFKSTTIKANEVNTADLGFLEAQWRTGCGDQQVCHRGRRLRSPHLLASSRQRSGTECITRCTLHTVTPASCLTTTRSSASPSETNQRHIPAFQVRYANFAIWLGDGGARPISGSLPAYSVFKLSSGETVRKVERDWQRHILGGFHERIDLATVPEGGPYKIAVQGYGCSYPFGVGGDFSRRLAHISTFRSLYHRR